MEKNKTGKYLKYAIGEIVLVVIGILIALSINNWNENRKTDIERENITTKINSEFKQNNENIIRVINSTKNTLSANKSLMKLMGKSGIHISNMNIDSLFYNSIVSPDYKPSQNTISFMVQSGPSNLIQNEKINKLIYQWKSLNDELSEVNRNLDKWVNEIEIPFLSKHISFREIDKYAKFDWDSNSVLKKDSYLIFQSLEFENILENTLYYHVIYIKRLEAIKEIQIKIISETEMYLKK